MLEKNSVKPSKHLHQDDEYRVRENVHVLTLFSITVQFEVWYKCKCHVNKTNVKVKCEK